MEAKGTFSGCGKTLLSLFTFQQELEGGHHQ
jgi:hypothetical protein